MADETISDQEEAFDMVSPKLVKRVDVPATVVQFLVNARLEDLVTELVQNELDAGSKETTIEFRKDELVCEGNGNIIDAGGWTRLSYLLAAGVEIQPKPDGIGAKNHGIRVGFHLGNDIFVQSGGLEIFLTTCGSGLETKFDPATWDNPAPQPQAPSLGCRIIIPYRSAHLQVPGRDNFVLAASGEEDIEHIFHQAVTDAPRRFIGTVRPGICSNYALELAHWSAGRFHFEFSAKRISGTKVRSLFRRSCRLTRPDGQREIIQREVAHTFALDLEGLPRQELPRFYKTPRSRISEVSWTVDDRGLPIAGPGKLRYPIEYPDGEFHSYSGLGLNFSAPFVSDTGRHGITESAERNEKLLRSCEARVPWLLRHYLIPRFGPHALELLSNPDRSPSEATRRVIFEAAHRGGLPRAEPTQQRRARRGRRARTRVNRCLAPAPQLVQSSTASGEASINGWSFVIPCFTWEMDRINPTLAKLCPTAVPQLHPQTPPLVIKFLASLIYTNGEGVGQVEGFETDISLFYSTFDEDDAIQRMQPSKDSFYPWLSESDWAQELGDPARASLYLEVIAENRERGELDAETIDQLREFGLLPNQRREPKKWNELQWTRYPVPDVPGVELPDTLHSELANVRALRFGVLKLEPFDLDASLSSLNWDKTGEIARSAFFKWLMHSSPKLRRETWRQIASYPVWPTASGEWVPLRAFCEPRSKNVYGILADHIPHAASSVFRIKGVTRGGRGVLALRTAPSETEVKNWYENTTCILPDDRRLSAQQRAKLSRLEREIAVLVKDKDARPATGWLKGVHRTANRKWELKSIGELHVKIDTVSACGLLAEDMAGGAHQQLYIRLGARTQPSEDALFRALVEDASNQRLLHRRIAAFLRVTETAEVLADAKCIRKGRRILAPNELALPSQTDYWGKWKTRIDASSLTSEQENHLRQIGVTGRMPTWETSKAFFEWLSELDETAVREHLPQVVRHFLHKKNGPLAWWRFSGAIACLPVRSMSGHIGLVSRYHAKGSQSKVYLPDFPEIEEDVIDQDRWRSIAIVEVEGVSGTYLSELKKQGVKSLRQACGHPIWIYGWGSESRSPELEELLVGLTSRQLRQELSKRLEEQGVPASSLRRNWVALLMNVVEVRVAEEVIATYKLGHYSYQVSLPSLVDWRTLRIWVSEQFDLRMALYEALIDYIFEEGTPAHVAYALHKAVTMEFRSRVKTKRRPKPERGGADEGEGEEIQIPPAGLPTEREKKREGERGPVHKPVEVTIVVPAPKRMPRRTQSEYRQGIKDTEPAGKQATESGQEREFSPREQREKDDLKEQHYAWHCQACLGSHEVSHVAPVESYAFYVPHRKPIIEAHHVHSVSTGGALGAGNLVILCQRHHNLLGDRMSQTDLRAKLRDEAQPITRSFPVDRDGKKSKRISGKVISLDLTVEPYTASLFFTNGHASVWLTDR